MTTPCVYASSRLVTDSARELAAAAGVDLIPVKEQHDEDMRLANGPEYDFPIDVRIELARLRALSDADEELSCWPLPTHRGWVEIGGKVYDLGRRRSAR